MPQLLPPPPPPLLLLLLLLLVPPLLLSLLLVAKVRADAPLQPLDGGPQADRPLVQRHVSDASHLLLCYPARLCAAAAGMDQPLQQLVGGEGIGLNEEPRGYGRHQ